MSLVLKAGEESPGDSGFLRKEGLLVANGDRAMMLYWPNNDIWHVDNRKISSEDVRSGMSGCSLVVAGFARLACDIGFN